MEGVRRRAKQFVSNVSAAICPIACLFVWFIPAMVGAEEPEPLPPSTENRSDIPTPQQLPSLPPDVASEVQGIERQVDAVFKGGKARSSEELQSLIRAAERAVLLRTQYQGKTWWETINAQQRSENLRRWANISAEDRAAWVQSFSLTRQAKKLYRLGKHQEAQPLYERVIAIREKVLGPDHPDTATSLSNLAVLYKKQGAYTQAQPLYQRALTIWQRALGPIHPWTAIGLNNLAKLYRAQGAYAQALPLYQRALAIRERVLGLDHPDTVKDLITLAALYKDQGQYAQALPLYQRALAIREKVLGPDHPDTASSLNNLASLYRSQGQYAQALPLHQRALTIWEKVLGPDHPNTAISLNNLAGLYQDQGQYAQALPLYQRALAITEKALGPDHPATATELNNLAGLYQNQGQYERAQPLFERALAIREKVQGPNHPDTAVGLGNLAKLYRSQGQYVQALPLLERAIAIIEKAFGPDHPDTAISLNNLAGLYVDKAQLEQALPLYQRALAITEKALGPDHPATATSLNDLGAVYWDQGQYAQALPLLEQALAITEKTVGADHPDTARSLNNLGNLYMAQGQYERAQQLLERALAIREKVLGLDHPNTAISLTSLGNLYMEQGQYAKAQPLYEQALAIREKVLGPDHPDTARSLNNLAGLFDALGQDLQALLLLERVLAIQEKDLGPSHPSTATSLNNLAGLFEDRRAYAQALPLYQRALAISEKSLGPDHPNTARSLNNLAVLYRLLGQPAQAQPLLERALAIREKVQGPDHPDTATSLHNLAGLYQDQGQYAQALPLYQRALAISEKSLGSDHPDTATTFEELALSKLYRKADEEVAQLLLRASQAKWQYLTRTFPTLSTTAQQQFLTTSGLRTTPQYFWPLFTALPTLDRAMGFQATLLSKQLVAETTRHESSALRQVLADAPPAWRTLWHQREDLRRQYATRALQELQDDPARPRPTASQPARNRPSVRDLSEQINQLEQQLRRDYPAYATLAQLEQISVSQVQAALRHQDLLLEYVQFRSYDPQAKQLTNTRHYGVYVVRNDQTPVVALDLGEAEPIDAAIRQFHTGLRVIIDRFKGMTPSVKQLKGSEAALAELSAKIRAAVWQPLEPHLRGATRVYVAPEGQLSLLPFEVLAQQTKKKAWQYLVEEQELVYLNTGRDLARLALTAEPPPTPSTNQAVLISNPTFSASPRHVAHVVAALPTAPPTMTAQGESQGGAPTLGAMAETGSRRVQVPRDWAQVPALDHLVERAEKQLTRAGWSVTALRHEQAVEEAVLRVQAPRLLQLATHGYLLDHVGDEKNAWDNPLLRSMLLFSGVNQADPAQTVFYRIGEELLTPAEAEPRGLTPEARQQARVDIGDGVLTAYEVTGMNLQGTELVNLTACETGLGQVTPDGVIGLRQAFLLAGARALTTSLWEVPADETTEQIAEFYQRWLGTGKNKTSQKSKKATTRYAAFRQTQLAALAKARAEWNGAGHPFFWAGTIYLGDPGDLPSPAPQPVSQP